MRVLRLAALAIGVGAALISFRSAPLYAASPRDAVLTPVTWLASHLKDADLVILQVGDAATYTKEHVPGAQAAALTDFAAPMDHSANAPPSQLMLELPSDDALRTTLERFGISNRSRIVIVESDNWFSPATRIYLTLVHAGLGARTTLLDGGLTAWKAAGQATTADVPTIKPGTMAPLKTVNVTVDAAFVQAHETKPGFVILDVRGRAAWDGAEPATGRGGKTFGHIPGSRSLPLEELWDETTSRLRPEAELQKKFAEAGVKPGDTVIAYCYIGQRATATMLAAQTLGYPVLLYDGSMDEWSKLNLPLELPKKGGVN
jgi:thiosulfate/3-mercaptopyruvate sulfurtransferase